MRKHLAVLSIVAVLAAWYAWPERTLAATQTLTVNGEGAVATGWKNEQGAGCNLTYYGCLQADDSDSGRLYTPTANDVWYGTLTNTSGLAGATINSVTVYAKYRSLDPVANTFQICVYTASTQYCSGNKDTVTSTSYILFSETWTTNPNTGAAWTTTALDGLEAGIKKINTVGGAATYMYAEVDYTAASAAAPAPQTVIIQQYF